MTEITENNRLQNGQFAPGNPGKPKGASKNRLRDEIKSFIGDKWQNFPEWFEALKPREKIETLLALLPYAVSRLQSVAMTDSEGNDLPENAINFDRLSDEDLRMLVSIQEKCLSNGNS
jgi:hypothetical protein